MNTQHDPKRYAVMYLRIARGHPDDATAIMYQREGCRRIAARQGLAIIREYVDVRCPARLDRQTELRRLLCDLERLRDTSCVVVWDYARLSRDLTELESIEDQIHACGAKIATITGVETVERFVGNRSDTAPGKPPP